MPYPPGWRRIKGDPGTASAARFDAHDRFIGYLNVTPRQSTETLANWAHFRVAHNVEEGDRDVRMLAAATGLRFRGGGGSCVRDSYLTAVRTRYIEIACLVTGGRTSTVVVGAAPPQHWTAIAPLLERAISTLQP
jgi:hypothetical protein